MALRCPGRERAPDAKIIVDLVSDTIMVAASVLEAEGSGRPLDGAGTLAAVSAYGNLFG